MIYLNISCVDLEPSAMPNLPGMGLDKGLVDTNKENKSRRLLFTLLLFITCVDLEPSAMPNLPGMGLDKGLVDTNKENKSRRLLFTLLLFITVFNAVYSNNTISALFIILLTH